MRLIDGDALKYAIDKRMDDSTDESFSEGLAEAMIEIDFTPTIVEFKGDINKVIVKGEEYHKQLTTTWLGNYCPYRCGNCGRYVDSKERYCPNCGRKAVNYE